MTDAPKRKRGGWAHNNKPASGIPAGGEGWGGPAKGLPPQPKLKPAGDEWSDRVRALGHDPANLASNEARRALLEENLLRIAITAPESMARVNASDKLLQRIAPVASKTDITSAGERIGYVIQAPPVAESSDEWAARYKPN